MNQDKLQGVEYLPAQVQPSMWQKVKGKAVALGAGAVAFGVSTVSSAAIEFNTAKTEIMGDIDSAEDFGVEIGLAILGFIAVISVLKHVRGAVK